MQIHYFQRYHSKENVDTSNTMLMLSRLYNYNADKFFASKNPIQKSKYFNLAEMFKSKTLPETEEIASILDGKTWEDNVIADWMRIRK